MCCSSATSREDLDVAMDFHVVAAEALLQDGRGTKAAAQLEIALAFYRSVRATRLIHEVEALLAKAQAVVG
jgi:hypothetical protein